MCSFIFVIADEKQIEQVCPKLSHTPISRHFGIGVRFRCFIKLWNVCTKGEKTGLSWKMSSVRIFDAQLQLSHCTSSLWINHKPAPVSEQDPYWAKLNHIRSAISTGSSEKTWPVFPSARRSLSDTSINLATASSFVRLYFTVMINKSSWSSYYFEGSGLSEVWRLCAALKQCLIIQWNTGTTVNSYGSWIRGVNHL